MFGKEVRILLKGQGKEAYIELKKYNKLFKYK